MNCFRWSRNTLTSGKLLRSELLTISELPKTIFHFSSPLIIWLVWLLTLDEEDIWSLVSYVICPTSAVFLSRLTRQSTGITSENWCKISPAIQSHDSRFVIRVRVVIIPSMKIRTSVKCRTRQSRLSCSIQDIIHCARALIVVRMLPSVSSDVRDSVFSLTVLYQFDFESTVRSRRSSAKTS